MPSPRQPRGRHGCFSSARSSAGRYSCSLAAAGRSAHLRKGRRTPVPACSQPVPSPGHALGTGVGCPVADPSRTGARTCAIDPDRSGRLWSHLARDAGRPSRGRDRGGRLRPRGDVGVPRQRPRSRGSRCVGRTDGCVCELRLPPEAAAESIDGLRVRDPQRGCSSRGALLAWTAPVQVGLSSGVWVMGRLVLTDALDAAPGAGLYMLHGYDRLLPAKDSLRSCADRHATFAIRPPIWLIRTATSGSAGPQPSALHWV